jgi:hypothetical protein
MDKVRIVLMQSSSIERSLGDALPSSSALGLINAFRVVAIPWCGLVGWPAAFSVLSRAVVFST